MPAIFYPPANRTAQWYNDNFGGAVISPNRMVWHTTETRGFPGYSGGASAPTLTYHCEDHEWRQHYRLDRSARALRNASGGEETNTHDACQVELICYSDEDLARSVGGLPVSQLDDRALRDLGDFSRFMFHEWGLRLQIDNGWEYGGDRSPNRMSFSEWHNFRGHTGHNRVPENTHWDPGRLDIDQIIAYGIGGTGSTVRYQDVWQVDDRMRAPDLWTSPSNLHWWPEKLLYYIGTAISELRDGQFDKPGQDVRWKLITFYRWLYGHIAGAKASINDEVLPRLDAFAAKANQLETGQGAAAAKLDQIVALLGQHAAGEIDSDVVVDGVQAVFRE